MDRYDIFLSYNRRDQKAVQRVHEALKLQNLKPWFDKEAHTPGRIWQEETEKGIESCRAAAVFVGPSGLGRWEIVEMRTLVARAVEKGIPVIPVLLPDVPEKPQLPKFLSLFSWVDLRGGITHAGIAELVRGIPPALTPTVPPSPEPVVTPVIPVSPERRLLENVQGAWLRDGLDDSVPENLRIELTLEECPEAVDSRPAPRRRGAPVPPLSEKSILNLFLARRRSLLILGATGSGKTTSLQLLAKGLAAQAGTAPEELPIPVIFNLSTWGADARPLALSDWLVQEMGRHPYQVGEGVARSWLEEKNQVVLPLLDGLDEVKDECRAACVDAINVWLSQHGLFGLAVCCNTEANDGRLQLATAVALQPLSDDQIDNYAAGEPEWEALQTVLKRDSELRELAKNPQLLDIMRSLCEEEDGGGAALSEDAGAPPEVRTRKLFERYVDRRMESLDRKMELRKSLGYPRQRTLSILVWLAGGMRKHNSSLFEIEGLQPTWLPGFAERLAYFLITRALAGALLLLPLALVWQSWPLLRSGLWAGAVAGLLDAWLELRPGDAAGPRAGIKQAPFRLIFPIVVSPFFYRAVEQADYSGTLGLLLALVFGVFFGARGARREASSDILTSEEWWWSWRSFRSGTLKGTVGGSLLGLIAGLGDSPSALSAFAIPVAVFAAAGALVGSFLGGLQGQTVPSEISPNQGIRVTLKRFAMLFLAAFLAASVVIAAFIRASQLLDQDVEIWLAPLLGSMVGFWAALWFCGLDVLQHYTLRILLALGRHAPLDIAHFLGYATVSGLLLRGGGSYRFRYGPILEHLAPPSEGEPTVQSPGAARSASS